MKNISNKDLSQISGGNIDVGPIYSEVDLTAWLSAARLFDGVLTEIFGVPQDLEGVKVTLHIEQPSRISFVDSDSE